MQLTTYEMEWFECHQFKKKTVASILIAFEWVYDLVSKCYYYYYKRVQKEMMKGNRKKNLNTFLTDVKFVNCVTFWTIYYDSTSKKLSKIGGNSEIF